MRGAQLDRYLRLIATSGLFDEAWYVRQHPDASAAPILYYLRFGAKAGHNPHPLFDTKWYLSNNPDVAASNINPLVHFIHHGAAEGRSPHPLFGTPLYSARAEDLGERSDVAALQLIEATTTEQSKSTTVAQPTREPDESARYMLQFLSEQQRFVFERAEIEKHICCMIYKPTFLIYIEGADLKGRQQTIELIEAQIYDNYEHINDVRELHSHSTDSFELFIWLRAEDILDTFALYYFASSFNADIDADLIYADDDENIDGRRANPFYKPDWSPDYLESFNYIGSTACFRASISAMIAKESSGIYDFILQFTERSRRITHIRKILSQRGQTSRSGNEVTAREINALEKRLLRTGRMGHVSRIRETISCYDIRLARMSDPLVSIVIPTAGKVANIEGRAVDLIDNCVASILEKSTYHNVEFVVVDNGDLRGDRAEKLRQCGCKMVTYSESTFNVAKKLNLGAAAANGDLLLLLNDDIEPLTPDWIERMLEHFEKPHVGVVGAKLLYLNGTTQHVGVVLNSGNPDHVRRLRPRDDIGYFFSTCGVRNFTAVTGACMMTRANIYRKVGGYNEDLPVSYNDVDYCLRVLEQDLTVVYAPQAELTHFESQTRMPRLDRYEIEYFAKKWASKVITDRFYNENCLTVAPPTFEVRQESRRI